MLRRNSREGALLPCTSEKVGATYLPHFIPCPNSSRQIQVYTDFSVSHTSTLQSFPTPFKQASKPRTPISRLETVFSESRWHLEDPTKLKEKRFGGKWWIKGPAMTTAR